MAVNPLNLADEVVKDDRVEIHWTEFGRGIVDDLARARFKLVHQRAPTDEDKDQLRKQRCGVQCEMSGAFWFCEDDLPQIIRLHSDGGTDFRNLNGNHDMKGFDRADPDLLVPVSQAGRADYYVCAGRPSDDVVELVGMVDAETLTDREPRKWPLDTENYVVPLDDLDPVV